MANPTEQASQGCVALLNLIVSAVILFILVFILMPGFIDLPEWAEDLRKNKLIEKRKVEGPVQILPNPAKPSENQVIVFNALYGGLPVKQILKKQTLETTTPLLITSRKANDYQRLWDKALPNSDVTQYKYLKTVSNFNTLYLLYQQRLRAWSLENGSEKWSVNLQEVIEPACNDCFQFSVDFKIVLILDNNQTLYSINAVNGRILWQKSFKNSLPIYAGFYLYRNSIGLLKSSNNTSSYVLIDILTGEIQKEIKLTGRTDNTPFRQNRNQLFYFNLDSKLKFPQLIIQELFGTQAPKNISIPLDETLFNEYNYTINNLNEWWREDGETIFLKIPSEKSKPRMLKINKSNGRVQEVFLPKGYDWLIVDEDANLLLLNAQKEGASQINELWVLSKKEGELLWKHSLQSPQIFQKQSTNMSWAAHLQNQQLIVLEWLDKSQLDILVFGANSGALQRKNKSNVKGEQWDGVTWTDEAIWLSIQVLYQIDLNRSSLYATQEFP
jgi:hypothetical protein